MTCGSLSRSITANLYGYPIDQKVSGVTDMEAVREGQGYK